MSVRSRCTAEHPKIRHRYRVGDAARCRKSKYAMAKIGHSRELSERIGQNIRRAMERQGWQTISGLARACGITVAAMSHYVKGERVPTLSIAIKISDVLNITLDQLVEKHEQFNENSTGDN